MNRLKELRKEKNFKMTQMADFLGIPYTTYVGYEKGERRLISETLKDFSKKLGVSSDYILGISGNRERQLSIPMESFTSEEISLIKCYRKATEKEKQTILAILADYK